MNEQQTPVVPGSARDIALTSGFAAALALGAAGFGVIAFARSWWGLLMVVIACVAGVVTLGAGDPGES